MGLQIQYESLNDASMRLKNSVVLYDGAPVYVESVDHPPEEDAKEIFRVRFRALPMDVPGNAVQRKYISSRKFDLAPFPMGFLNTPAGAVFCSRAPARQQSQGLTAKNLISEVVPVREEDNVYGGRRAVGVGFDALLQSANFPKMVKGDYPSFDEACVSAKAGVSMAFCRELCVAPDRDLPFLLYLYHKTVKVGVVNHDGTVQLGPKRKCLKELLAEKNVKVRD